MICLVIGVGLSLGRDPVEQASIFDTIESLHEWYPNMEILLYVEGATILEEYMSGVDEWILSLGDDHLLLHKAKLPKGDTKFSHAGAMP